MRRLPSRMMIFLSDLGITQNCKQNAVTNRGYGVLLFTKYILGDTESKKENRYEKCKLYIEQIRWVESRGICSNRSRNTFADTLLTVQNKYIPFNFRSFINTTPTCSLK